MDAHLRKAVQEYEDYINRVGIDDKLLDAYVIASKHAYADDELDYAKKVSARAKELINGEIIRQTNGGDFMALDSYANKNEVRFDILDNYYSVLHTESPYIFDSYLLYLEKDRLDKDKFYKPRRRCLRKIGVIDALQSIEDDELDLLSLSFPPSTGKTTIEKFFTSWVIGKDLDGFSLFFSHSGDITRMFYDGIIDITTNSQEYKWNEVFPQANLQGTNAKAEHINFGKYKPFSSIQCTSVGSKNAGKVRCSKYLMCDDMIGGIEEALNKNILDKLWSIYSVDARQRKTDGCKEIHIATRWSVHDIIGRLQSTFENDPRARFIAYPDINPETGESNFDYDINGFSVEFYHNQALLMDDISYRCLYKNEPIEREGLLYHDDDLRRYMTLPLEEPDAIIGVCDTKTTGSDFMVLPVFHKYGDDYYMVDCICDNSSDFGIQESRLANMIVNNNMQQCEFESNAGGSRLAKEVADRVEEMGGRCNITTKPTETNKETRIIVNSDWIKKHCLFKDKELYTRKSDYGEFMYWLLGYSVTGKNVHDDVPDCLSNFALYCTKDSKLAKVEVAHNPFRGFW